MGNLKSIVRGTQSAYTALATKDNDTLYFIKDKGYLILRNANGTDVKYGNGFSNLSYNQTTHILTFTKADGTTEAFDCSPFIYQGMIDDVKIINVTNFDSNTGYLAGDYVYRASDKKVYKFKVEHRGAWNDADVDEISGLSAAGGYLFIDFNTEAGKTDIYIPLTSIFNPANYYTKSEINARFKPIQVRVEDPANSGQTSIDFISNIEQAVDGKITPTKKTVAQVQPSTGGRGGSNGLMTAVQAEKLDGIADGAEPNQNAFSYVKVGDTSISADSKMDNLEIVAGTAINIIPNSTNNKLSFSVPAATESTPGYLSAADKKVLNVLDIQDVNTGAMANYIELDLANHESAQGHSLVAKKANSSTPGILSSIDWNTFNNKQNAVAIVDLD